MYTGKLINNSTVGDTSQLDYESLAIKYDEAKKRFIHPFSAHKKFDFARDLAEKYRVSFICFSKYLKC